MTAAIIGDGAVAADNLGLFDRAGLPAVRVAVADVTRPKPIGQVSLLVDACGLPPEPMRELFRSLAKYGSREAILCSRAGRISARTP